MTPTLTQLVAKGESKTLEFKRSTGELREALQTLCAFANGAGGRVVIGVKPDGQIVGQQVSEQTFHEIASARDRFEPPIEFEAESVELATGRAAIVLSVAGISDSVPFTYDAPRSSSSKRPSSFASATSRCRAASRPTACNGSIARSSRPRPCARFLSTR